MLIAVAVAGLLLAQAAAPAAGPPAPAGAAAAPAKADKPKKPKLICEQETSTDSIIPKRVCRTPEQIEAERITGRKQTDAVQDLLRYCQGTGC